MGTLNPFCICHLSPFVSKIDSNLAMQTVKSYISYNISVISLEMAKILSLHKIELVKRENNDFCEITIIFMTLENRCMKDKKKKYRTHVA